MATPTSGSGNLVDEFEEAFQSCLNVLTKDETSPNPDKDETKVEVEQTTLRFIDLARQMEAFFLQKRFLLSALKPELVINNDISDLRLELGRKEELLKRHYEKISHWQNMLADVQGWAKSPAQGPTASGMSNGNSVVSGTNGMAPQQTPGGPQTPNSLGVTNMPSTLQQVQQMHQVQQQQMQQAQLQQQMQAQLQQQQQQQQMHAQLQQQMQVSSQQAMFMQQGAGRGGFGSQGPPSAAVLQGPLAYLEKTTSNIGMTDGRR